MSLVFPTPTKAKLIDVNPRSEAHGDVKLPALDLRFEVEMSNAVLALLHPELRNVLYVESPQGQLPGVDVVSEFTDLRFPELAAPFRWMEETYGNNLTIDWGIGGEGSDILLNDCKLHKQTFEPKTGGTCTVRFTVSCANELAPYIVGTLAMKVQHDLHILLNAAEPFAGQ
jgi:hypothetical protein